MGDDVAFYRIVASNGSGIVSYDNSGLLSLTNIEASTSFRIQWATNASGAWASNEVYTIIANTGHLKKAYLPMGNISSGLYYAVCILTQSQGRIWIDQNLCKVTAYLWRNFFPGTLSTGVYAIISLVDVHSNALPTSLGLAQVWLLDSNDTWNTGLGEQTHPNPFTLEGKVRDGVSWESGIFVDVILEVTNTHERYLLQSTNNPIIKVE